MNEGREYVSGAGARPTEEVHLTEHTLDFHIPN